MKSNQHGRGPRFWFVVTVGALLMGGMAVVDGADAVAANWLRQAFDAVAERERKSLDADALSGVE